jgi:hypothetical protein
VEPVPQALLEQLVLEEKKAPQVIEVIEVQPAPQVPRVTPVLQGQPVSQAASV